MDLDSRLKRKVFDYAGKAGERPEFVPHKVQVLKDVRSDLPFINMGDRGFVVRAGEHECDSNPYGAISVKAENGKMLGIKPSEYEVISWVKSPHVKYWCCNESQERLTAMSIEEAIEEWADDMLADGQICPDSLKVYGYAPKPLPTVESLAKDILASTFEDLECEYADPDDYSPHDQNDFMPKAMELAEEIIGGFIVWACERVSVIEVDPHDYLNIYEDGAPAELYLLTLGMDEIGVLSHEGEGHYRGFTSKTGIFERWGLGYERESEDIHRYLGPYPNAHSFVKGQEVSIYIKDFKGHRIHDELRKAKFQSKPVGILS